MRKKLIFYVFNILWIIIFLVLAIMEGLASTTGLQAIEVLGRFVLFSILCIIGILTFVIAVLIQLISIKRSKRNK